MLPSNRANGVAVLYVILFGQQYCCSMDLIVHIKSFGDLSIFFDKCENLPRYSSSSCSLLRVTALVVRNNLPKCCALLLQHLTMEYVNPTSDNRV